MIVFQTDSSGRFVGAVEAESSPLESDVFLIPGGCVESAPPEITTGHMAVWGGSSWTLSPLPDDELRALALSTPRPTDPARIVTGWHPEIVADRVMQIWDTRPETEAERKVRVNGPILEQLAAVDAATVRPLRSLLAAQSAGKAPDAADVARLTDLDTQAAALRRQLLP